MSASPDAHLLVGDTPAAREFESRWWGGPAFSIATHALGLGVLLCAATRVSQVATMVTPVSNRSLVFLTGGGGSGRRSLLEPCTAAPGNFGRGVTPPAWIHEVKPNYTAEAMRAKLQGSVEMAVVVRPDGTVDPDSIRITRSLDPTFGLDQQAIIAVKQWRFRPGTLHGQPVAVIVNVELTFTLR